jgi:hypothetical protein
LLRASRDGRAIFRSQGTRQDDAGRRLTVANNPKPGRKREPETRTGEREAWRHVRKAHATGKGEHQIAEYVAELWIGECARILAFESEGLPRLAALRDECRVGRNEDRTFEEVIRTWTVAVLSGAEGG